MPTVLRLLLFSLRTSFSGWHGPTCWPVQHGNLASKRTGQLLWPMPPQSRFAKLSEWKRHPDPVTLAADLGFAPVELRRIERLVKESETDLLEAWYGYFGQ